MQIIAALIGILAVISIWYWRLQQASRGARHVADAARTAANMPRRLAFKYKSGKGGLALIDDPREAAAIMMMEVALARGPLTEAQNQAMIEEMKRHFNFSQTDAEELIAHAGWVNRDAPASHVVMEKMSALVLRTSGIGPRQIVDLDSMLVLVSEANGLPTEEQLSLIQIFRNKAGLKT